MTAKHDLTPAQAAAEVERMTSRVHRRAQWPAWMFLGVAAVNFAFFVVVGSANHRVSDSLSPVPALLAVAIFLIVARQPVIGADAQRINRPILIAAIVTTVSGLIIDQTVMPKHFTGWLVLLAAVMVSPYLVGAWRWLHR
jgi:hypothetical protein